MQNTSQSQGQGIISQGQGQTTDTDTGAGPEASAIASADINGSVMARRSWRRLPCVGDTPGPRSGAASVVLGSKLYVFGGYGGEKRLDDFYEYCFISRVWRRIELDEPRAQTPGPRENNGFVTFGKCLYLFGGYNGYNWLNDTWEFNTELRSWRLIMATGTIPSHRFGFVSVTYENKLILFGGYNGTTWLNDMYALDLATARWTQVEPVGLVPSRRSCPAWVQRRHSIFMFGGYDGVERKNDLWEFRIRESRWVEIKTADEGYRPIGRYFHACGIHGDLFYVFGGYQGAQRLNDMHQFSFTTRTWRQLKITGEVPSGRSSLVAHVYENSFFVFGGYNGRIVLNDFFEFPFLSINVEPPRLTSDLAKLIDHELFSDVTFMVENRPVRAVRALLAARSEHFRALLFGGMREDLAKVIELPDIQYDVFRAVVEYLYTDAVEVTPELAVPLLVASERYILPRLKSLCEVAIFKSITPVNCVQILLQAYMYNADSLKNICLDFIVDNIVALRATPEFQELKQEPELLMEIIMRSSGLSLGAGADSESVGMTAALHQF
ncbi:Kelch domain-containing protein 10 [Hondaea fermentalgiana]|uniref:Kelch domain-containing protein 10 n=1 Tax=Hondaea fermentalgiana TaxID=2315210 RepID=A0A2R5GK91_9STRA|nr:Kelch domain-containing protein 10 [Hondaea fermentalgiana]|eukprot:GBG28284.1 Kelch domain-containing protein 10 [Hondaea fermentalgiana]